MDRISIDDMIGHSEGQRWGFTTSEDIFVGGALAAPTEIPVPQPPAVPLPGEEPTVGDPLPPVPPPPYITPGPQPEPEQDPPKAANLRDVLDNFIAFHHLRRLDDYAQPEHLG